MDSEVKPMKIVMVKVADIKPAKYNPPGRVEVVKLQRLVASIQQHGLIYPLALSQSNQLIDGHRRFAALKQLGHTEVPVVYLDGNAEALYETVNTNSEKMTGKDTLGLFLQSPATVSKAVASRIKTAEKSVGREALERLFAQGYTIRTLNVARRIARYCDRDTPEFTTRALDWMLEHQLTGQVDRLIRDGVAPRTLAAAIEQNRLLKTTAKLI